LIEDIFTEKLKILGHTECVKR